MPGGKALEGDTMSAKVRIDDNDFLELPCSTFVYKTPLLPWSITSFEGSASAVLAKPPNPMV